MCFSAYLSVNNIIKEASYLFNENDPFPFQSCFLAALSPQSHCSPDNYISFDALFNYMVDITHSFRS